MYYYLTLDFLFSNDNDKKVNNPIFINVKKLL